MYKSGFVGIIGRPNVGKSTLMNTILGEQIAIASNMPQTTRHQIKGIHTTEKGQIVFVDTPGVHQTPRSFNSMLNNLALNILDDNSIEAILYIVDLSRKPGEEEAFLADRIFKQKKPVILVYNKIDESWKFTDEYNLMFEGKKAIEISALNNTNVDVLLDRIYEILPEGIQYYDPENLTDRDMRFIACEIIRKQLIHNLVEELPHASAVMIDEFKETAESNYIEATIYVESESQKGIVIGKGGAMIKKIREWATKDLKKMMDGKTSMHLWVKVKPNWRKDDAFIRALGYECL